MSERAHFWLRIVALAVILAAEFGPRLTSGAGLAAPPARVAAAASVP
jgi:hypothetical protein